MSYTVKHVTDTPYPEWWIYDEGERDALLIGKAFSAEKAAEFAAVPDLIEKAIAFLGDAGSMAEIEARASALIEVIERALGHSIRETGDGAI